MYKIKRRFRSCVIGLAAGLVTAMPVLADDTEIYIGSNQGATVAKPNVLFILDTSGSMDTQVTTTTAFNPATTYTGACASGRIFWSTSGSPPACTSDNWFDASKMRCQAAAGPLGTGGVGTYTDRLARWLPNSTASKSKWSSLSNSVHSPPHVECQADQGVHGSGTGGGAYIANGTSGPWKTSSTGAANWSATGSTYTTFSANYLNWYHFYMVTNLGTRIQIVKDVVKSVVDSNTNINIGLMRYDTKTYNTPPSANKGGPVIFPMSDIDAANVRNNFKATVDSLTASGWTPLSETLYEAYRYFSGQGVVYGKAPNNISSVPGCLNPSDSSKYKSPLDFECQKNFIVYLTDGLPTYDGDADLAIGSLLSGATLPSGDKTCAHGITEDPLDNCLDELAEYLHETDLRPDLNGKQNVTTYTIGFSVDDALLRNAATKGGGKAFTANNFQELSSAFTQIVTEIRKISDLFSAPAVSVNAYNRLYHNSELYFSLFRPAGNIHWPGNVKRFKVGPYDSDGNGTKDQYGILDANDKLAVDPNTGFFAETATSFWTPAAEAPDGGKPELGGSVSKQPDDPNTRKVFTYTGDYSPSAEKDLSKPVNKLHESNSAITGAMLNPISPVADPEKTLLLKWARGVDVDDENANGVTTDARKAMGDPLHASPVLVSYGLNGTTEDMTLFVTSNDGYLHAINTVDGTELFSFVPKEMLARLKTLRDDPALDASGRSYGLDGPMTVWIKENPNDTDSNIEPGEGDHVYLYFGQRRGGRNYYAVDVTDRDAPKLLWKIEGGVGNFKELGETWSAPKHTKVKIGSTEKDVLIFGGGYDPSQETATVPVDDDQGRAIYMVDAETGARLWWTGNNALSPAPDLGFVKMTNSIPANVRVIDLDHDGLADRMYAADLRGQLWRFDINNGASGSGLVSGALMAELQKTTASATPNTEADNRRFFNEPDAALIVPPGKPSFMSVSIGSGSRAHPLNKVTQDRFYVVRDPNPLRKPVNGSGADAYPSAWPLTEADLYDVTTVINFTNAQQAALDAKQGWRINLVDINTNNFVGEKVLNEAVTFGGVVLFDTFTPVATQSASACAPATGTGRIYALNILNGKPVYNLDQVGNDQNLDRTDRATNLTHPGIPPKIVIFFPKPEGGLEGEPTPVVGSEILNGLKFKNPIVKTYWYRDEVGM